LERYLLSAAAAVVLMSGDSQVRSQPFYYQYNSLDTVPLFIDSGRVTILVESSLTQQDLDSLVSEIGRISEVLEDDRAVDDFVVCSLIQESGYTEFLDSLRAVGGIQAVEPYYRTSEGLPVLVGEHIRFAIDTSLSSAQIETMA